MDVTAAAGATSEASKSSTKLADDFDNFLALLTTQLQYQDPLDPMDSSQFTEQLVSFTQVEQSIATNKNLENLISQTQTAAISDAVNYLGTEITVETDRAGLRDGKAKWEYGLQTSSEETKLIVQDAKGEIVYEGYGETKAGLHEFIWDAPEGTPDGIYKLTLKAESANGSEVQTAVYSKGVVESIETLNGQPHLSVNGILTPTTEVQAVNAVKKTEPDAEDVS
ncbi:flagellar hook assembly protein FlgD [Paremcibacter congregatus]|uniref:flagellar hook assembly protein FlgD n=1 Tax=Paremcibacter congregatus TaxID=2043170 RepID=UPI003A949CBC